MTATAPRPTGRRKPRRRRRRRGSARHEPRRPPPPRHPRRRQLADAARRSACSALLFVVIVGARRAASTGRTSTRRSSRRRAEEETAAASSTARRRPRRSTTTLYRAAARRTSSSRSARCVKQLPEPVGDRRAADRHQPGGLGRGLQFELFKPAAQERMADFYAELPISIRITGNYHDMGAFASDVAQLPRIVTLNDVAIAERQGRAAHGRGRQDVPLPRRGRDREAAQPREAGEGQGEARNERARRTDRVVRRARSSPAAAARATRTCAQWMAEQGKGAHGQARAAAADQAVRAVRLQRVRPARPVQAAQDRAARRAASRLAPDLDAPARAARGVPARVADDGRHAREGQGDVRAGAHARQGHLPGALGQLHGTELRRRHRHHRHRDQAQGTRAGQRRRLDRADQLAATAAARRKHRGEDDERISRDNARAMRCAPRMRGLVAIAALASRAGAPARRPTASTRSRCRRARPGRTIVRVHAEGAAGEPAGRLRDREPAAHRARLPRHGERPRRDAAPGSTTPRCAASTSSRPATARASCST